MKRWIFVYFYFFIFFGDQIGSDQIGFGEGGIVSEEEE